MRHEYFELTFSLWSSFLSNSLSFRAFASLCMSDGSFRSLLKENAADVGERPLLEDTKVLAFSDISKACLSGRTGGTLSANLKGASLLWLSDVPCNCLPLSADGWICLSESSAIATTEGPELSEGMRVGLGCTLACLLSSEGLRCLGDWSPWGGTVVAFWLVTVGLSWSETGTSDTALTGDFVVRARAEGRPGATFGLTENRFLLWIADEEMVPSPFWSLPSLNSRKDNYYTKESSIKMIFMGHLMFATHPWAVGLSDGVKTNLLSVTVVAVLLSLMTLDVSLASWSAGGDSWSVAAVLPVVPTLGRILNLDRRNILTWKHTGS